MKRLKSEEDLHSVELGDLTGVRGLALPEVMEERPSAEVFDDEAQCTRGLEGEAEADDEGVRVSDGGEDFLLQAHVLGHVLCIDVLFAHDLHCINLVVSLAPDHPNLAKRPSAQLIENLKIRLCEKEGGKII